MINKNEPKILYLTAPGRLPFARKIPPVPLKRIFASLSGAAVLALYSGKKQHVLIK